MPPALPPREPASFDGSSPNRPQSRAGSGPSPAAPPAPSGLIAENALLRRTVARLDDELAGLRRAMASRALIDQAKGAVRALTGASEDEAFALLSARSQHHNRKLVSIAADVLAAADVSPERHRALARALHLADPPTGTATPTSESWQSRRRSDRYARLVGDPRQLVAVADLAELLCAAPDHDAVVGVLVGQGAAALGAFGATLASVDGSGEVVAEAGVALTDGPLPAVPLDATHPLAEVIRDGSALLLTRAELAFGYPAHPRPERLQGLVVLPLAIDTPHRAAWSLCYDHPVPGDRGTRAMLDWAARVGSAALQRAG